MYMTQQGPLPGKKIDSIVVGDIGTNCWLYALEDEPDISGKQFCAVIDPGDEAARIIDRLKALSWFPRYVFLTHGHFDHLAGLPDLLEQYSITIGIHRLDADYLGKNALAVHRKSIRAAGGDPAFVDTLWKPLPDADILFEEGDTAGPFKILHVPGHSRGSVCFYDEKAGVLFSGDTLFRANWGRTDLPGGNETQIYQSLARLLSMKKETVVCPGHGPATTIGNEEGLLKYLHG